MVRENKVRLPNSKSISKVGSHLRQPYLKNKKKKNLCAPSILCLTFFQLSKLEPEVSFRVNSSFLQDYQLKYTFQPYPSIVIGWCTVWENEQ